MSHLHDEQLELIMAGETTAPAHLETCEFCTMRLVEKQALAARLRRAFDNIKANEDLANRILAATATSSMPSEQHQRQQPTRIVVLHKRLLSSLAAAAAIILFAIPGLLYISTTRQAQAAQLELSQIHQYNLGEGENFLHTNDPNILNRHNHEHNKQHIVAEKLNGDLKLYGCCTQQFRNRSVETYVVETTEGLVTVLLINEEPQSLGMKRLHKNSQSGSIIWSAVCADCNMAALRVEDTTHVAMGKVSHAILASILEK